MNLDNYTFRVIIEPDEASGFHAYVPLLKGLHTQGKHLQEVKENLREAIICHLQGLVKDNEHIPVEGDSFESITTISRAEITATA